MWQRETLGVGYNGADDEARPIKSVKWDVRDSDGTVYVDGFIENANGTDLDVDLYVRLTPAEADTLAALLTQAAEEACKPATSL